MAEFSPETAVSLLAAETRLQVDYAPETASSVQYEQRPWIRTRNPKAGTVESRWAREHPELLNSFRGTWVAILGDRILKSGTTVGEVYDFLRSQGYADALIMKVPLDQGRRPYLIARWQV